MNSRNDDYNLSLYIYNTMFGLRKTYKKSTLRPANIPPEPEKVKKKIKYFQKNVK
jgi:hypothetical protein